MNKTININLGGIFFHIDEIAYSKLKKYLDAIRRSLSDDPKGKDEIITDIESRIGEILSESVKDVRQVVNGQDIDSIIEVMGKPEDYIGDEEFFEEKTNTSYSNKNTKKLYRDTNDKFLGGVSSGLSHYFGIDVIWVRLIWLLMLFGGGIGFLLYIILWILLPEAHTTSEKLEMEGEAVNINNIEKKIREELTNASQFVKDGIEDVSNHLKKNDYQSKVRTGSQEIVSLVGRIFTVIFNVFGKFIGIILIFTAGIAVLASILGLFTAGSAEFLGLGNDYVSYPDFFHHSRFPIWLLFTFLIFAIAIPFIALFMIGLKIVSPKSQSFNRTTKLSLLGVWLFSMLIFIFVGLETGANYANENTVTKKVDLNQITSDTIKIKMVAKDDFKLYKSSKGLKKIAVDNKEMIYGTNITLNIKESEDNSTYLKVYKKSSGGTFKIAKERAEQLVYNYKISDNNLILNAYYLKETKNRFTNQKIKLVLYLPKGKTIFLDKSTRIFLYDVDNVQDIRDRKMTEHYYKMIEKGLNCLDCDDDNEKDNEIITTIKSEIIKIKPVEIKPIEKVKKTSSKKTNKHVTESENGLEIN